MLLHLNQVFYFHLCDFFGSSPTFPSLKPKFPYPTFPTCPNYSLLISYAQTIPWQPITPLACPFANFAVSHLHAKKRVPLTSPHLVTTATATLYYPHGHLTFRRFGLQKKRMGPHLGDTFNSLKENTKKGRGCIFKGKKKKTLEGGRLA